MGTKGTWQRPGDRRAYDRHYERIFAQKASDTVATKSKAFDPDKTITKRDARKLVARMKAARKEIASIYYAHLEACSIEDAEVLHEVGMFRETEDIASLAKAALWEAPVAL
jgi:uncharacterized protein with von Willebrand factor type A (vWA) domain